MIILTQPGIKAFNPKKVSSVISYCGFKQFCLAQVSNNFNPTEKEMIDNKINFWWAVEKGHVDTSKYQLKKYDEGIIYGIENQLNLTRDSNIAFAIHQIADQSGKDVWKVWEESIM